MKGFCKQGGNFFENFSAKHARGRGSRELNGRLGRPGQLGRLGQRALRVMTREAEGKTFGIAPAALRSTVPPAAVFFPRSHSTVPPAAVFFPRAHPGTPAVPPAHKFRPHTPVRGVRVVRGVRGVHTALHCPTGSCVFSPGHTSLSHRRLCYCTRTFSPPSHRRLCFFPAPTPAHEKTPVSFRKQGF